MSETPRFTPAHRETLNELLRAYAHVPRGEKLWETPVAIDAALAEIDRLTKENGTIVDKAIALVETHAEDGTTRFHVEALEALRPVYWERIEPRTLHICACPVYSEVKGPYPSGICKECGRWYPPKKPEASQ